MTYEAGAAIQFGQIVIVRFPFTNQTAFKQRPVVVVSNAQYNEDGPDVVAMGITSKMQGLLGSGNVPIAEWQIAGLMKPSAVKPVFATIEKTLIVRRLGSLQDTDLLAVRTAIAKIIG